MLRALPAMAVIGVATFTCFVCHLTFPTVSFVFLIVVVLQSLTGDFLSSVVVSVAAFLCLNYFFVPPIFSLAVSDPSDTLAMISFLVTGLVVTRLTSWAHRAAEAASIQRSETTRLYELARELLAMNPDIPVGQEILRPFTARFGLRAVSLFDAAAAKLHSEGISHQQLEEKTRSAYIAGRNFQDSGSGVAVRVLQSAEGFTGAIGFEGLRDVELTAEPLAALASVIMDRSRAFRRASSAAAAAEAEVFRGVVLDALAHEFKTPLATIVTAAGGLREVGSLDPEQHEFAEIIESEATRLGQLTSRLLRTARLDREEAQPQLELTNLKDILWSLADQYRLRWPDHRVQFEGQDRVEVLADRELLRLGIGQVLDNACKYSGPGSSIAISIEITGDGAAVRVWNNGTPIPLTERARIFDRFYRGTNACGATPGSGLGLYVARKIALAHGGNLDLEDQREDSAGTTFRFTIPVLKRDSGDDADLKCASSRR